MLSTPTFVMDCRPRKKEIQAERSNEGALKKNSEKVSLQGNYDFQIAPAPAIFPK